MRGDEESLTDYLDGRMAPADKAAFEARLAAEPALERRLRLLRAMRASLKAGAPAMPADLKAALKRQARERAARPRVSWLEALRASLGSGLGCGVGAAFVAALLAVAVKLALPRHHAYGASRAEWKDDAASAGLQALWIEDDGRDGE
jgi:anti-sigma factor RsiW